MAAGLRSVRASGAAGVERKWACGESQGGNLREASSPEPEKSSNCSPWMICAACMKLDAI